MILTISLKWTRDLESNQDPRFCKPVHKHSATARIKNGTSGEIRTLTTLRPKRSDFTNLPTDALKMAEAKRFELLKAL